MLQDRTNDEQKTIAIGGDFHGGCGVVFRGSADNV